MFALLGEAGAAVRMALTFALVVVARLVSLPRPARLQVVPDLDEDTEAHHHLGILLVTFSLGVTVGAIYEMYEWFDVRVFGGGLHVGYGDTIADLFDDALASLGGGALLVWWATRGWGTTRRVPPRRLDERLSRR